MEAQFQDISHIVNEEKLNMHCSTTLTFHVEGKAKIDVINYLHSTILRYFTDPVNPTVTLIDMQKRFNIKDEDIVNVEGEIGYVGDVKKALMPRFDIWIEAEDNANVDCERPANTDLEHIKAIKNLLIGLPDVKISYETDITFMDGDRKQRVGFTILEWH